MSVHWNACSVTAQHSTFESTFNTICAHCCASFMCYCCVNVDVCPFFRSIYAISTAQAVWRHLSFSYFRCPCRLAFNPHINICGSAICMRVHCTLFALAFVKIWKLRPTTVNYWKKSRNKKNLCDTLRASSNHTQYALTSKWMGMNKMERNIGILIRRSRSKFKMCAQQPKNGHEIKSDAPASSNRNMKIENCGSELATNVETEQYVKMVLLHWT